MKTIVGHKPLNDRDEATKFEIRRTADYTRREVLWKSP